MKPKQDRFQHFFIKIKDLAEIGAALPTRAAMRRVKHLAELALEEKSSQLTMEAE